MIAKWKPKPDLGPNYLANIILESSKEFDSFFFIQVFPSFQVHNYLSLKKEVSNNKLYHKIHAATCLHKQHSHHLVASFKKLFCSFKPHAIIMDVNVVSGRQIHTEFNTNLLSYKELNTRVCYNLGALWCHKQINNLLHNYQK